MRRFLLAATTALTLAAGAPAARALDIVHDPASNALRIAEAARAIQEAIRRYEMMRQTYEAIAHTSSVSGLAGALGGVSRTFMPPANSVPGLMAGRGGSFGQAQQYLNQDRVYAPAERDEWAEEMERRERVTANAKALAAAGMEDTEARILELQSAQAEIEAAPDGTAGVAVGNLLTTTRQNLAAHEMQLQQVRLLLAADDRVIQQRAEQRWRRDVDDWAAKTASALEGW